MSASRAVDAAILVVAVAVAGVGVLADERAGWAEFVFGTVVMGCVLAVLRLVVQGAGRARAERQAARRLAAVDAEKVARTAVVQERVRLASDIEAVVRASVTRMGQLAADAVEHWPADPVPSLHAVQEEGRRAVGELRRMLGLLREAEQPAPAATHQGLERSRYAGTELVRTDGLLALAVAVLSVVERYAEGTSGLLPGMDTSISLLLTAVAASMIGLRRVAPALGAAASGLIFIVGFVSGRPVASGFWVIATLGGLSWASMVRRRRTDLVGVGVLLAGVAAGMAGRADANMPITVLVILIGACGGMLTGWSTSRGAAARTEADRRGLELTAAAADAVRGERTAVARDLHDVVSHAVGVMVMQAGAAEALRPTDPDRAWAALEIVRRTANETLTELDRLVATIAAGAMGVAFAQPGATHKDTTDLLALVERIRAAGLDVHLDTDGALGDETGTAVYRIVQESLTNALRHASGAHVLVTVRAGPSGVTVEVVDDGPGPSGGARRGYGLAGIAERVQGLGGQLQTGPAPNGVGFSVCARLPAPMEVT
jgi:signal transduction histidine kinase